MALSDVVGTDLIPAAKEWADGRKPADLCLELFVRTMQGLAVLDAVCYLLGGTMDEIFELAENKRRRDKEAQPCPPSSRPASSAG